MVEALFFCIVAGLALALRPRRNRKTKAVAPVPFGQGLYEVKGATGHILWATSLQVAQRAVGDGQCGQWVNYHCPEHGQWDVTCHEGGENPCLICFIRSLIGSDSSTWPGMAG